MNEKMCPKCGKMIPENANFCPYCETSLVERETPEELKKMPLRKKKALFITAAAVVLLAAALFIILRIVLKRVDAEATFRYEGKEYHLLLRQSVNYLEVKEPQPLIEKKVVADRFGAVPSQLYVFDAETGKNAREEFTELIQDVSVKAVLIGSGELSEVGVTEYSPGFPEAVYETDIFFGGTVRENRIVWTLTMKNGKKVELAQLLKISVIPVKNYDYREISLTTAEELQRLIDEIGKNEDPDTLVNVNLGPYTYKGNLNIENHAVNLKGCVDGEEKTVIEGTLTVNSIAPLACELTDIVFRGSGIGIQDNVGVFTTNCEFNGLDIGINVGGQGYGMPTSCTFRDCRVGFLFNSTMSTSKRPYFDENVFVNCKTAILFQNVPGDDDLWFYGGSFEGNGTDIDNRTQHLIEYDGVDFR